MILRCFTEPGAASKPNEDWCGFSKKIAVVLDGLTSPSELPTGCIHDVPWYVNGLGELLLSRSNVETSLEQALYESIDEMNSRHQDTCDIRHPGTPSATVVIVRAESTILEYLVLSDSTLVVESGDQLTVISDKSVENVVKRHRQRVGRTALGTTEHKEAVLSMVKAQQCLRNTSDGYWVASSNPEAARHSLTGTLSFTRAVLASDGAACLVDNYRQETWDSFFSLVFTTGPESAIKAVRDFELNNADNSGGKRYKRSDDATLVTLESR